MRACAGLSLVLPAPTAIPSCVVCGSASSGNLTLSEVNTAPAASADIPPPARGAWTRRHPHIISPNKESDNRLYSHPLDATTDGRDKEGGDEDEGERAGGCPGPTGAVPAPATGK